MKALKSHYKVAEEEECIGLAHICASFEKRSGFSAGWSGIGGASWEGTQTSCLYLQPFEVHQGPAGSKAQWETCQEDLDHWGEGPLQRHFQTAVQLPD